MTAAAVAPVQRCAGAAVPAPGVLVLIRHDLFLNVPMLIYPSDDVLRSEPRPLP